MQSKDFEQLKQQLLDQQNDLNTLSEQMPEDTNAAALRRDAEALDDPVRFKDSETEEMLQKTDKLIHQLTGSE